MSFESDMLELSRRTVEATERLADAVERLASGLEVDVPEPIVVVEDKPLVYFLPHDDDRKQMNKVYGIASKDFDSQLDWFQWPANVQPRLYTRKGSKIVDHDKDVLGLSDHRTNKKLADRVTEVLQTLYDVLGENRFHDEGWHVYGGSHMYRPTTGGSRLSTHAWAAALDFNPTENAYRSTTTTFSDEAFDVWEHFGFLCAWRAWVTTRDPMHVQAAIPRVSPGSFYDKNGLPENIKPL